MIIWTFWAGRPRTVLAFMTICGCLLLGSSAQAAATYWEDFSPQASVALDAQGTEDAAAGRVWIAGAPRGLFGLGDEYDFTGGPVASGLIGRIHDQEPGLGEMINRRVPGVSSQVTEPIPEPATFWLLGTGLLLLGGRIKRKLV